MSWKLVIAADFHPEKDKWTGLAVIMGIKGTHENYDVIYNGICDDIYFDSERAAKTAAWRESKNHKYKMKHESKWRK